MSGLNSITSAKVPGLLKLLADLPNVTSVGRVLTYNALNSLADSLGGSSGSIDFSTVNADYLMNPAGLTKTVNTFNPKGLTTAVNGLVNPSAAQRANEISLRQEEIAKISNVVSTVFDSTYGVVDNAGQVNLSSLKLGSVSTDYLLDPLLDGLSGSHGDDVRIKIADEVIQCLQRRDLPTGGHINIHPEGGYACLRMKFRVGMHRYMLLLPEGWIITTLMFPTLIFPPINCESRAIPYLVTY